MSRIIRLAAALGLAIALPLAGQTPASGASPVVLSLAAGASSLEHEGPIRTGQPVELVFSPVPDEVLETRLLAREGEIEMSVYRDDSSEPESGSEPGSGAVGWTSAAAGATRIRFVVRAAAAETRFRLTLQVRAAEPPADE